MTETAVNAEATANANIKPPGDGNTSFLRAARAGNLDKVLEHLKNNIDINTCNANGLNALHLASKDGHVHVVSELLRRGATVDAATKKGNTALHIASLAGQEEVVKLLLQHGASVNVQSQNGFTPLYMAAQENHDSVVKLLLSNSANQSLATEDGFTPLAVAMQQGHDKVVAVLLESDTRGKVRLPALHIAAKKDDVKAATLLLENDHNPDVTSKSGFTPLHIASHYGNEAIANLLIQKGADVNYAAKHNISPLHVAAKWGKTNMVSLLLEKGANIEAKTRDGLTPLHCAARSGHEQVVDMLLERGAPISAKTKNGLAPLHMAAQGEHVDAARILLYHRAPVDEVTVDYLTALHVAAHCGHVRVAKLLLDRNADANARALNGFTPLHIACKKNRIKVVELLLRHGASISATTESGLTPLHVASFMGCMNIVIYLLQHDASPDVPTVRGETPLHLAARANQTDIIRILLRNGAQVDARAREQQTPLHIASRLGNVDIVMLLLQHGAQVDATTKDMYTALHIAAKEGQDEVAAALIENGASLDATTKKGFTPLHLTAKYGHMKVAQLLLQKDAPVDAQGKNGVTPLHVASHYDHQNVALLLLEKGASPHATAKNGHTPLHIAARKNQMDIATTLLEYGAQADAESKAGFTPLHLSSQEGHVDMSTLLLEHKAGCDHQAKNGLTPLHLCAQEDKVNVAQILCKNGANIEMTTKAGYTPLHVASHFGQANMVRFLLQNGSNVDASTGIGYTPLHQAAQQGHCHIVNLLLEHKANANAQTANGQTPLHIAKKLGYISVLDSLKASTNESISPIPVNADEKYRVVAPEAMHETFMSDSEEEGGEDTVLSDQPYRYLTVDEMKSLGDDSLPIDVTRDERMDSNRMAISTDSTGQIQQPVKEDIISPHQAQVHMTAKTVIDGGGITIEQDQQRVGRKLQWKNFLVSFLVDARGGAMRGMRHSGVRIIIPARSAGQPTRVTCRYVKPQRTMHPPQLMEGEALASRVLEIGPVSAKFLGPVVMEVPHFASLRGKEREIVILRSDNGETWREHTIDNSDEIIHDVLNECFEPEEIAQLDELGGGRFCRFVTYDFPQYFAVVSRIRQEVHAIGPEGGMVSSTVVPQVQAVFPQGALTKKIKVGLQAQPIDPDLTAKLLGRGVAVSPIVTVEPRRRKFHKAITLSMPAPKAHSQGMINQYSGNAPTLRLLCSITGGPSRAQWEDVTGSTPLTFVNDCVSFTTTVSARFWLMDCRNISEATKMATELYREAIHVPFMAKFVVFAKRIEPNEARLRVFCMTDDKEDKTLEQQECFTEVAKSRDVEVLESKPQYIEMAGNLVPVTKSGDQLQLTFKAFRENRLPFNVRIKDQHADTVGRTLFMREPKVAKGEPPQQPICILNIVLPDTIIPEQIQALPETHITKSNIMSSYSTRYSTVVIDDQNYMGDMRIVDVSNLLGEDWMRLAPELGFTENEIDVIKGQNQTSTAQQALSMIRIFKVKKPTDRITLENGLKTIGREDIITKCKTVCRKRISIENGYDESDLMKDSESIEDLVRQENNRLQQMREREELKYSAEEKEVEESESDDEIGKRTVAERRQKIEKRLSLERAIPASTQKREIVQEITEIKRKSLIEDKKAIHEEEIMLQMPTDNIIKSNVVPDQIIKLKTGKIETPDVSKTDFDKELQDKFKKTIKLDDEFQDKDDDDNGEDDDDDIDHAKEFKEDYIQETSKIVYDSTITEKSRLIETTTTKTTTTKKTKGSLDDEIETTKETIKETIKTDIKPIVTTTTTTTTTAATEEPSDIKESEFQTRIISGIREQTHDKQQIDKGNRLSKHEAEEYIESTESRKEITKIQVIDTEDPDLEKRLTKQKEKIEESETKIDATQHQLIHKDSEDSIKPKSYPAKPRESLTEEEFYKSIEATITKKMSEGLIEISDDILSKASNVEIPESQTPPPTPSEYLHQTQAQTQDHETSISSKRSSPESVPEQTIYTKEMSDETKVKFSIEDFPKESGGQTTIVTTTVTYDTEIKPKPTPRLSKTISEESKAAIDALISATSTVTTTTTTTVDEHKDLISTTTATTTATTELKSDDSTEQKSVTTEENNFKQSKIFWESLESQKTDSEDVIHKSPKPSGIPVPKPRTKTTTPVDSNKTTEESLSTKSTSISSDQNAVYSQETSKETSSEEVKEEAIKDEQKDITKEDEKSISSSVDAESKSVSELDSKKPGFYIGDSSDDIIKRSIPDKRSDYAIDSEAYRSTLDDEQQEIPYDEPSAPSPEHDISSEEQKKSHYETDEEQDSHSSKSGPHKIVKKTESYTESETDYRKDWQKMDNFEEHTLDSEEKDIAGDSESPKRFAETLEKKSKIETGFEQADMDLTAAGLAKIEKEQFESRLFRQGSETRNDILEFEIEGKYCEESFGSTTKTDADAFIEGIIHDEASDTKFKAEQSIQGDEKVQKMEFTVEGKKQDDPTTFVKIERKSHLESADLKSKSKVETEEIVQTDVSPIEVKTKVEDYSHSSKAFETQQSRQEEITDDCSILKSDVTFTKTETKKISSKRIEEIHKEIHQIDVMEHILDEFKAHEEGSKLPEIESQKPSIVQELVKEVISSEDSSSFPSLHSDHSFLSEQMYSAEHHFPERKKSTSELAQYFQSEMDKEEKEIKEQSSTDIMHEQAENLEKRMEAIHQEIHQIDTVEQMIEGLKEHEKEIHHTEFEDYKKAEGKEISHETVTSEIITEFPATHETHISSLVTEHTEHFPTKEAAAAFEYDDDEKVFESHEEKISECMQYQRDEKILQTLHDGKIVEDKTVFQEMRIADEPQLKVGSIEIVKSPLQVAVIETVPSDEVLESDSEKIIMEIEEAPEIIAHQTEEETVTFEKAIVQGVIEVEERKPLHTAYMEESDIFVEHIIEEQQPEGLSKAVIQELETSKPVYTPASAKAEAILTSIKPLEILKDKDTREEHKDKDFLDPEDIFEEEALTDQHIDDKYKDKTHKPASISPKFSEQKVKFDHKLDLNLEKSETEVSEKYSKSSKSEEEFKKSLITDPSQVDTSMVVKTLEEVEESLDAVQEELIEVVKDGKLIKQSPSEFEFKILSSHHMQKYAAEPIHESFHEESSTTGSSSEQQLKDKPESQKTETTSDSLKTDDFASLSSTEDSSHRLDVVHRIKKDTQVDSLNRLSGLEQDHSSSSDSHYRSLDKTESSRPASSDLDNLITYGNSSEYQTALDASLLPESAEYVSAISSFDSSGKTISSQESMKSLDSELSNLGSVEISEASETLIGSIGEGDLDREIQEVDDIEFEVDDKLCGVLMEEAPPVCQMKRSQEMIFTQDDFKKSDESPEKKDEDKLSSSVEDTTGRTFRESTEKLSSSMDEASRLLEESKFSLEEGSLLSMSLSSASAVDTVVENIDDLASSLGASSLTGFEMQSLIRDDFTGTSFEEPSKIEKIDSMTMTISSGKDEDTNFANTQITTIVASSSVESSDSEPKRKGHKRSESTAFGTTDFLKGISKDSSSLEEEEEEKEEILEEIFPVKTSPSHDETATTFPKSAAVAAGLGDETKKGSESESDTDPYESEYARAFRSPTVQKKKSRKSVEEIFEKDQEPEKRPFTPSQLVSEVIEEDATEELESIKTAEELERRPSQNMQDYSNIPNITITEDRQRQLDEEDDEIEKFIREQDSDYKDDEQEKVLYKMKTQDELDKAADVPLKFAKEKECSMTDEQLNELIQQQYQRKLAEIEGRALSEEDKAPDSPDSFEMLEQPDISDEFVIIEEVAKEADEFDMEGKSVSIKPVKYEKKHDEEVEKILVSSAPADPHQGSIMYREGLNFEFEESPPTEQTQEEAEAADLAAANKRWVEMQMSDNGQMRYPYEVGGTVLEDIKEEDGELEVGSSRISSFKDSFSSTPEYDVLAGRKYFTKEHDDISMSSLQEFENLEQAISLENRKLHQHQHQGSQDSLSNGSFTRRYMARNQQGDDVSLSSLKEFEGLENACLEAHLIEIKAKEEAALLLSRSDESNKSGSGKDEVKGTNGTSITTTSSSTITQSLITSSTNGNASKLNQQQIEALIKSKLEECEEEPSNLMEVSTDSLDLAKKSKSTNNEEKKSELGSSDSLEINRSGDIMTSSIDSFEISKDATARSSRSEGDSLEQQLIQEGRRDSIDSIELEQAALQLVTSGGPEKQITISEFEQIAPDGSRQTITKTTTIMQGPTQVLSKTVTSTVTSSSITSEHSDTGTIQDPIKIIKNISSDSLNLTGQTDPDLLLTSTESLDRTSSAGTNATYQNENESIMTSSVTSCASSTLMENLESTSFPTELYQSMSTSAMTSSGIFPSSGQFTYEEMIPTAVASVLPTTATGTFSTIKTTTTTTTTQVVTKSGSGQLDEHKLLYEHSDLSFEKDFEKLDTASIQKPGGEEEQIIKSESKKSTEEPKK